MRLTTNSWRGLEPKKKEARMNEMIRKEELVAQDLTQEQRQQVVMIAISLERDFGEIVGTTFAAAYELKIEQHVAATGLSLAGLLLAAHLHAGSEASFFDMARQALVLCRTEKEVQ
jgi:hypothetical protein